MQHLQAATHEMSITQTGKELIVVTC